MGNGLLYLATADGEARALDVTSSEQRWSARLSAGAGGGLSLACGTLLVGNGYHDFESKAEPLTGGLQAFTISGAATDCGTHP